MYAALCAHMYYVPVLRGVVFAVLRRLTRGPIAQGVTREVVVCAKSDYMMIGLIGHPSSHLSAMAAAYCCRPLLTVWVGSGNRLQPCNCSQYLGVVHMCERQRCINKYSKYIIRIRFLTSYNYNGVLWALCSCSSDVSGA